MWKKIVPVLSKVAAIVPAPIRNAAMRWISERRARKLQASVPATLRKLAADNAGNEAVASAIALVQSWLDPALRSPEDTEKLRRLLEALKSYAKKTKGQVDDCGVILLAGSLGLLPEDLRKDWY